MRPINFPEQIKVLSKPDTMTDNECGSLAVWSDGQQCVSLWKPTLRERLSILFFGKVWLAVYSGQTQPPVSLTAAKIYFELPRRKDGK